MSSLLLYILISCLKTLFGGQDRDSCDECLQFWCNRCFYSQPAPEAYKACRGDLADKREKYRYASDYSHNPIVFRPIRRTLQYSSSKTCLDDTSGTTREADDIEAWSPGRSRCRSCSAVYHFCLWSRALLSSSKVKFTLSTWSIFDWKYTGSTC